MSYIGNAPTSVAFLTDTFSGNAVATTFTLSAAPATTSSIIVAVSGVLQDPSTYAVAGTTLTFSAAPPTGTSNISVRFLGIPASGVTTTAYRTVTEFTATAGQTTFSVPSYTVGFIDVYRNGVMLGSADYTATNGTTVVLASGATAGDLVETISFYVSSVLNAIPATAGAVNTSYITDGAITTAKIAAGAVVQADLATGVAGTGPAFSAYQSLAQTLSSLTVTKILFQTEEWDTNNNFASSRFTPTVAGYYQVNGQIQVGASYTNASIWLYKNGTDYKAGYFGLSGASNVTAGAQISAIVYLNGSTDYIEIYAAIQNGQILNVASSFNYFQGFLARAA
jgi:hypothetical protein